MKMNRLLGVGMLCFGMLAWNAYGIDRDVSLAKQRVFSGDTGRPLIPSAPAAGFGNTCADLAGGADVLTSSGGTLSGDNSSGTNDFGDAGVTNGQDPAGCNIGATWGSGGGDQILEFTVDQTGPWTLTTCPGYSDAGAGGPAGGSGLDTSLMILEDTGAGCPGDFSLTCNGDGGGNCPGFQSELVNITLTVGTTYYLLVDAWSAGTSGPFTVAYHGPCADDADCTARDQDVFCNGTESCGADGICTSPGDPCAGTGQPVCDEGGRQCLACNAAPDPAAACGNDDDPCNGIETCDPDTGACSIVDPCPDGLCNNGECQTAGSCVQTGESCRIDQDCPFFASGQTCTNTGAGSLTRCYDGRAALGTDIDCLTGEVCVPTGDAGVTCVRDSCNIYTQDFAGYFWVNHSTGELAADDFTIPAAPAGRELVSYSIRIVSRHGTNTDTSGPYDLTMELWSATDTDPLVDPNAGLPGAPIAGSQCFFANNTSGVGGPVGTPGRTTNTLFTCNASQSGVILPDNTPAGIDVWITHVTSKDTAGFSLAGSPPLSQGVIVGSSGDFWFHSNSLPAGEGGVGWSGIFHGGAPFDASFGSANVCTVVVGPCCLGVAGCEMLSADECANQGGTYQGDNDQLNPITCAETRDGDGIADLCDNCPDDDNISQVDCNDDGEGDKCEANEAEQDRDFDGECNGTDGCPDDPGKTEPLQCGCGNSEDDTDNDGTADCNDNCVNDPNKVDPGTCGCGTADEGDEDGDGFLDCVDQCRGVDDAVFAPECDGAIPAVSEWGLLILAMLLLVAAKIYFGRQRALL